jgi:hypothetical protein
MEILSKEKTHKCVDTHHTLLYPWVLIFGNAIRTLHYIWYQIIYINSLHPSMMELGSFTEGRSGLARHSWTPGFSSTELAVGVLDRVRHRKPTESSLALHGCDGARRKKVVCVLRGRVAVAGAKVSWVSSVSCLFCSRRQRLFGTE